MARSDGICLDAQKRLMCRSFFVVQVWAYIHTLCETRAVRVTYSGVCPLVMEELALVLSTANILLWYRVIDHPLKVDTLRMRSRVLNPGMRGPPDMENRDVSTLEFGVFDTWVFT
jgi:hypothetical protein